MQVFVVEKAHYMSLFFVMRFIRIFTDLTIVRPSAPFSCIIRHPDKLFWFAVNHQLYFDLDGERRIVNHKAKQYQAEIQQLTETLLNHIGEDPNREGLQRTPERVADMWAEVTGGYDVSPDECLKDAVFEIEGDSMLVVKDIEFYSLCEHHLLPFFGKIHVGYIPKGKAVGLGKIPQAIDMFARRLQIQERLTEEVASLLEQILQPRGVGVVAEGFHLCLAMRGMQNQGARLITSAMRGSFRSDEKTRGEFLQLLEKGTL